jgi:cobalt-zinc-cadmium efflux system protein
MTSTHNHAHLGQQTARRLAIALGVTLAFVIFEAFAGWQANSLALLSDAAHNLTNVIALALSWYALRLAAQPANAGKTFGYHRAGILAALVNSTTLVVIALGIFYEAFQRINSPLKVEANTLIGVGMVALLVNAGTAWLVERGSDRDLNLRSTFVHLLGGVMATMGAIVAGIVIAMTGLNWLDPLVSAFIGLLILGSAWGILRETIDILLEGTPRDIDMSKMVRDLLQVPGVRGVHDLHVWSLTQNMRALSAHVVTDNILIGDGAAIRRKINAVASRQYGIAHATQQLECGGCQPDLLYCDLEEGAGSEAEHAHEPSRAAAH